jgi:streptomycin 3"-adenylyltransferase
LTQTDAVVRLVRDVLGDDVAGAYLYGSAVQGGLRPDSDLDVLVVAARPTTRADVRALVAGLLGFSGARARHGPARPVELTVVAAVEIRPWRYPPRCEFQYGEWLRDDFERGELPDPWPSPDLAILTTAVRRWGRPLLGPAPTELLDPVPKADVVRAISDSLPALLADLDGDERNVLLTLARMWLTLATGDIVPKDTAAEWAARRLPPDQRAVLERARSAYLNGGPDRWDSVQPLIRSVADDLAEEIRRLAR